MLVLNLKDNLAEFNLALLTNSKLKMLGEVSKLSSHIKFGDYTIEMKLETYQHLGLSEITITKSLILD